MGLKATHTAIWLVVAVCAASAALHADSPPTRRSQEESSGRGKRLTLDDILPDDYEIKTIGQGYGFCEGPAADAAGNVYFSDGKNNSIYFYEIGKPVRKWAGDSLDANGMMFNKRGELLVCEGAAFRVVAFDLRTKEKRPLISTFEGKRFNEPNDLTIDSTCGFYFTDPNYRHRGQETVRHEDAYYVSAKGEIQRISDACQKPNGIHLSADEKWLYLCDNRGQCVYRYAVEGPGKVSGEEKWLDLGAHPDGMTLDAAGNSYIACGGAGVKVYSKDGELIGIIPVEYASNVVFGERDFRTLFITSRNKFLAIETKVEGLRPLPVR